MTPLARTASVFSLFTVLACSTTPVETTNQWGNPKFNMTLEDPEEGQRHRRVSGHISLVSSLSMLSGRFVGTGPENDLTIELERLRDPKMGRVSLLLTVSGRYRDNDVRRSGLVRLAGSDAALRLAYYPDFEPGASIQKASVRDRPSGRHCGVVPSGRHCGVVLKPRGESFSAETSCESVLPGEWALEIGADGIRLENVRSGETLRFAKLKG
jgi:hypothetical protein